MICFRDYQWLLVHGASRFSALINTDDQKPDDVFWSLDIQCVAGGAVWRRVGSMKRPRLTLEISSFKPHLHHWTDLEKLNFWNTDDDEGDCLTPGPACGWLDADFCPRGWGANAPCENSFLSDGIWRVAARDGGWLTVELAAVGGKQSIPQLLAEHEELVTAGGQWQQPDADFWKTRAEFYLLEEIPFGTVTVRVPRNVRDPEAYAVGRARKLTGTGEPEHIEVTDHLKRSERYKQDCPESIGQDIYVELHFNGFYED